MIGASEIGEWADRFGVGDTQVGRDHFVSHLLAGLSEVLPTEEVALIGGTALSRSHLDGLRLSEDIDLLVGDHRGVARELAERLPTHLRREFPDLAWVDRGTDLRSAVAVLSSPDTPDVQLQVIRAEPAEERLGYEQRLVALRYSDLPATAEFRLPTLASFAVMKMAAWQDRFAPRDLFDLWGLAGLGAVDAEAIRVLRATIGFATAVVDYERVPAVVRESWETELAHQTGSLPSPDECLRVVRTAIEAQRTEMPRREATALTSPPQSTRAASVSRSFRA